MFHHISERKKDSRTQDRLWGSFDEIIHVDDGTLPGMFEIFPE